MSDTRPFLFSLPAYILTSLFKTLAATPPGRDIKPGLQRHGKLRRTSEHHCFSCAAIRRNGRYGHVCADFQLTG
jgi:hypothetical protein